MYQSKKVIRDNHKNDFGYVLVLVLLDHWIGLNDSVFTFIYRTKDVVFG